MALTEEQSLRQAIARYERRIVPIENIPLFRFSFHETEPLILRKETGGQNGVNSGKNGAVLVRFSNSPIAGRKHITSETGGIGWTNRGSHVNM